MKDLYIHNKWYLKLGILVIAFVALSQLFSFEQLTHNQVSEPADIQVVELVEKPSEEFKVEFVSLVGLDMYERRRQLRNELEQYELNDYEINMLISIGEGESNLGSYDSNIEGSGASGLFQIMPYTWDWMQCEGDVMNWKDNVRCSILIYRAQGFEAWAYYTLVLNG